MPRKPATKKAPAKKRGGKVSTNTTRVDDEEVGTTELVDPRSQPAPLGSVGGETDASDIVYPRLTLMHNVSQLVNDKRFEALDIVLNGEVCVANEEQPVELAVLSAQKVYEEDVDFDSGETPRIFNTIDEVKAAGLWIDWQNNEAPPAYPKLTAIVAVKMPEHCHFGDGFDGDVELEFPYEDDNGDRWAVALWDMRKSSFTNAAKPIITASGTSTIHHLNWSLQTTPKTYGRNTVTIPKLRRSGSLEADTVAFLEGIVS